jgi:hypothetical protein
MGVGHDGVDHLPRRTGVGRDVDRGSHCRVVEVGPHVGRGPQRLLDRYVLFAAGQDRLQKRLRGVLVSGHICV